MSAKSLAFVMEIDVSRIGRLCFLSLAASACIGSVLVGVGPALADKVHWKDDALMTSCSGLAFDDTDEWFATSEGVAFKKGVCHGQRIQYRIDLAPDRESFTVYGTNTCTFKVGTDHQITIGCRAHR